MSALNKYLKSRGMTKVKELGEGGTARVYLCKDPEHGLVAVKHYRDDKPLYMRELSLMKELGEHPNIIKCYGGSFSEGPEFNGFIILEYIPGVDLDTIVRIFRQTTSQFFYKMAIQLLSALEYCHERHIYHRDLSVGNVMICMDNTDTELPLKLVLIDFGIGCRIGSKYAWGPMEKPIGGQNMFTWHGELNEELMTERTVQCNDLWLVGVVLYTLAYGISVEEMRPGMQPPMIWHIRVPGLGGYPVPPDFSLLSAQALERIKPDLDYIESFSGDQKEVLLVYQQLVMGPDRNPVYDFDHRYVSSIHDVIRLLMPRDEPSCFSAPQVLRYIHEVWVASGYFGLYPQRAAFKHCDYPCEDSVNNFHKEHCTACKHCQWNDEGERGADGITIRCRSKAKRFPDDLIKEACLSSGKELWNPYRHSCEDLVMLGESDGAISARYSILFKDGFAQSLPVAVIRDRVAHKDWSELETDENVRQKLRAYPYHPLKLSITAGADSFVQFFNKRGEMEFAVSELMRQVRAAPHTSPLGAFIHDDLQQEHFRVHTQKLIASKERRKKKLMKLLP